MCLHDNDIYDSTIRRRHGAIIPKNIKRSEVGYHMKNGVDKEHEKRHCDKLCTSKEYAMPAKWLVSKKLVI